MTNKDANGLDGGELPSKGGIDVFEPLFIRQPILNGMGEEVRELLTEWSESTQEDDTLLPLSNVSLVTLFYDNGEFCLDEENPSDALIWYIETTDARSWDNPDDTVRRESPIFDFGLDEFLTGESTVKAGGIGGNRFVVYGTHPNRQDRYEDTVGSNLVSPVAGDELPIPVVLTSIPLNKGLTSRITARAVDFSNWIKSFDFVSSILRDKTETIEDEAMYTESFIMESSSDCQVLHYYMETEDMSQLYEGYENADSFVAKVSDRIMNAIFRNPSEFLEPPLETDYEVLIHSVNPNRP